MQYENECSMTAAQIKVVPTAQTLRVKGTLPF